MVQQTGPHFTEAAPKLRAIFQQQATASAGSLHLVGLESLKERLGSRWDAVADRVMMVTERLLAQTLSPADAWFRYDGERFVVVFARLDRTQAGLICANIVTQLQKILLGEADTQSIQVHSAVAVVGQDLIFQSSSLQDMLDGAVQAAAPVGTAPVGTAPLTVGPGTVGPPPVTAAALAAEAEANWATRRLGGAPPGTVEVLYRPVWDRRNKVLSIYLARAMIPRSGRMARWGYDCVDDPDDFQQVLHLDLTVFDQAMEAYADLYRNQFRFFLALPVHFESLATQARRAQYLTRLRAIPPEFRPFIYFYVVAMPSGVPTSRAADIASVLRPFSRGIIVVVDIGSTDLSALAAAGIPMVHLILPPGARPARWGVDMAHFVREVEKQRMQASIEGVDVAAMEACAEAAGFNYLAGDVIGSWSEAPEHILRFTADDMHDRLDGFYPQI